MAWARTALFTCVTVIKGFEKCKVSVEFLQPVFVELPQTTKSNTMQLAVVILEGVGVHSCHLLCISFKMWQHITTDYSDVCCICKATWGNESALTINILSWFQPIFQQQIQWMWMSYMPIITSCNISFVKETVFFHICQERFVHDGVVNYITSSWKNWGSYLSASSHYIQGSCMKHV
jgi:hypothetical protein